MKLSEAIRLGAMIRPQARGVLRTFPGKGHKAATCALGSALEALGCKAKHCLAEKGAKDSRGNLVEGQKIIRYNWPKEVLPTLDKYVGYPCDFPCEKHGSRHLIRTIIPHLNDVHHWSRERIADWVATIEAQQEVHRETAPATSPESLVEANK